MSKRQRFVSFANMLFIGIFGVLFLVSIALLLMTRNIFLSLGSPIIFGYVVYFHIYTLLEVVPIIFLFYFRKYHNLTIPVCILVLGINENFWDLNILVHWSTVFFQGAEFWLVSTISWIVAAIFLWNKVKLNFNHLSVLLLVLLAFVMVFYFGYFGQGPFLYWDMAHILVFPFVSYSLLRLK